MTVLDNKKISQIINSRTRNSLCFLVLVLILSFSCKKRKTNNSINDNKKINLKDTNKNDSLIIHINSNVNSKTGLNVINDYLHYNYIEFEVKSDSTIMYSIHKNYVNQILKFVGFKMKEGNLKRMRHYYLIDSTINDISFDFEQGDLLIKPIMNDKPRQLDNLFNSYEKLNLSENDSSKIKELKLNQVYQYYSNKFSTLNKNSLLNLNDYFYYDALQTLNPMDERVENYLKGIDHELVASDPLNNLLYFYIKNRIDEMEFNVLNKRDFSKKYIKIISIGLFNYLRNDKNLGKKYKEEKKWLKTTQLYKNDSVYIKKEISPLNSELFASKLERLTFESVNHNKANIKNILDKNSSEYYLIDFWATWCAPCIQGIKTMKNMDLPDNVKVISISVDKNKDKEKWVKTSNKLNQSISYWIDGKDSRTQEFMNFIKMKSIPRYILIDKNMNLIDESYYHPSKPKFLTKLQDVENHKYW